MLARATGRSLLDLTDELIAKPLQINQYYMPLSPTQDAYMAGGVRLRLRDFLKLAQLYLNEGEWNGHKILTTEWCQRATSPLYKFSESSKRATVICGGCTTIRITDERSTPASPAAWVGSTRLRFRSLIW